MAELLVYARDTTGVTDPGRWKRGEVVTVQEDGWPWGSGEDPAGFPQGSRPFAIVRLPGVPVAECERYVEEWTERDAFTGEVTARPARRRWQFEFAELMTANAAVANAILTHGQAKVKAKDAPDDGTYTLPWVEARAYLRDKRLNVRETRDL